MGQHSVTCPAPGTRRARSVDGILGTSCSNNEDQSSPTVQGLGRTPGLKCQVGNSADEQRETNPGRRAGVKELKRENIDSQPEIH